MLRRGVLQSRLLYKAHCKHIQVLSLKESHSTKLVLTPFPRQTFITTAQMATELDASKLERPNWAKGYDTPYFVIHEKTEVGELLSIVDQKQGISTRRSNECKIPDNYIASQPKTPQNDFCCWF